MILAILSASLLSPLQQQCSLATDDTQVTVKAVGDQARISDLRCRGESHAWCTGSPISLIDKVWVDGKPTQLTWRLTNWEVKGLSRVSGNGTLRVERGETLTLAWKSQNPALEIRSIWRARKGRGPVEHRIEIVNRSPSNITVPQQESLSLSGLNSGGEANVWWIRRGASNAMTQGGVYQNPVRSGLNLNLVSDHHDGASPVPWLAVQVGETRGLYLGWEFSGRGRLSATSGKPDSLELRAGLLHDFKTDIHPGETLAIPTAFVGCYKGDIDEGSQSLHRFVMEHLRANPPADFADPTTVCGIYLDAGGDHATEATLLPTIAFAKDLNLDTFLADAMWFPACGDWRWDPARFPHGVKPIREAIHNSGMKFALWCAWDNGGVSSDPGALSVRGPVGHPDWFGQDLAADWQPGPFYGVTACMASPEAKAWALKKTQTMASEMGFDFMKTDVHPMISDCIRADHRHSHGTDVSYWSALGVYEVWDELRTKNPKLVLENCSGASHIKDFGVIQRCAYTATTDTLSNLPDRAGIYDSTFVLPPSALMTYTYERGYNVPGDDPGTYLFRSAMMTAWDLAPTDSKHWTAEEKASARASTRVYREWLRPILQDCQVHHVLPRPDGKHWDGMFFWSEKLRKGTLFVFRPDSMDDSEVVKLAGLDPSKKYLVWSEDESTGFFVQDGKALMEKGIHIDLLARYTSDLIHLQDASLPMPASWGKPGELKLLAPAIDSDPAGASATLHWSPSQGARAYQVTVSMLDKPVVEKIVYEPTYRIENAPQGSEVVWAVQAFRWGGYSPVQEGQFKVPKAKPWPGVFVSDLPWIKAEAGSDRVHKDENYAGKRLSLGGKPYLRGIWTHAFNDGRPADIVVDIAGKGFGTFAADAGLDDSSGGGSIQFQILIDGKVSAQSANMKSGQVHRFHVDIAAGAKTLTLRVLNGGDGYTSDHADWGLARLIKVGQADPFADR